MSNTEILFLKQEDEIKAGLLDMKMALEQTEKAFYLMGKGEVINPAKIKLGIPEDVDWNVFFMSMPAYIKGDINIAGFKWAAESKFNPVESKDIPYGIDVVILSNPHTVQPVAIMDGTIITAMRTSAAAGVCAEYTARKNSEIACLVGAGVIGRTMIMSIMEAVPNIKEIRMVDLDPSKVETLKSEFAGKYNITAWDSVEKAAKEADLLVTETTANKPIVKYSWLKKNATVIQMSAFELEEDIPQKADKLIVDCWQQVSTLKGGLITHLVENKGLKKQDVIEIQELATGEKTGRDNDDQFIVCATLGVGTVDITVAHKIYQNAKAMGIGQKLNMWDNPLWV